MLPLLSSLLCAELLQKAHVVQLLAAWEHHCCCQRLSTEPRSCMWFGTVMKHNVRSRIPVAWDPDGSKPWHPLAEKINRQDLAAVQGPYWQRLLTKVYAFQCLQITDAPYQITVTKSCHPFYPSFLGLAATLPALEAWNCVFSSLAVANFSWPTLISIKVASSRLPASASSNADCCVSFGVASVRFLNHSRGKRCRNFSAETSTSTQVFRWSLPWL